MNKTLISIFAALLAVGIAPGAFAETYTASYNGASPGLVGLTINTAPYTGSQFGGARFVADGSMPLSVEAVDMTGAPVYTVVCQDPSGTLCGETGEPRAVGCGSVDLSTSVVPFNPDMDTVVFVYWTNAAANGQVPSCVGTATIGSITLTTEA